MLPRMAVTQFDITDVMKRLARHVPDSDERLEPARRNRFELIREMSGRHYSIESAPDNRPLSMLEMCVTTWTRSLIGTNPAVRASSDNRSLKVLSHQLGLATTKTFKQIQIEEEWTKAVFESMFFMGCCLYGLTHSGQHIETANGKIPLGRPFCKSIDGDSLVIDMSSTTFKPEDLDFVGHRYTVPARTFAANPRVNQAMVKKLSTMRSLEDATANGSTWRASRLAHGDGSSIRLRDRFALMDLFLPEFQVTITVDARLSLPEPLLIRPYSGPYEMPYDFLWYTEVPSNLLKLPPISNLQDLHKYANIAFNKAARDAQEAKSLIYAQAAARRDAERVQKAPHGTVVTGMNPPELLTQIRFRGADQNDLAFVLQAKQLFNAYAGNVEAVAGLGPQSDTLGQDEMIVSAANGKVADMKKQCLKFYDRGANRVASYLFHDPFIQLPLTYRMKGFEEFEASDILRPEDMRGEFFEHNFSIVPFSEMELTPQQKLQAAMGIFQVVAPYIEIAAQQGEMFQVNEFIRSLAELANVNDVVQDWFLSTEPPETPFGTMPQKMGKMGGNGGEYIHRNVSGTSRQGQETRQIQSLLSSGASNDSGGGIVVGG